MTFEIPSDLNPALVGLAWLRGRWERTGYREWPGEEKLKFAQQVDFAENGGEYLHYLAQAFEVDDDGLPTRPLFMATGKRYSPLARLTVPAADSDLQPQGRKVLAGYTHAYLRFVVAVAAGVTVTAYCLWAFEVGGTTTPPWSLISIFPFVLALLRYGADIFRGEAEAPEDAVLSDRVLLGAGVLWVITFGLGAIAV